MIIISLSGGLGNQMFQYALGYSNALRLKTDLWLDLKWFKKNEAHNGFELEKVFKIHQPITARPRIIKYLGFWAGRRLNFFVGINNWANLLPYKIYREPFFQYWHGIKFVPDNSYLSGYWQSERYFIDVAQEVKKLFAFPPPTGVNARITHDINECESVSIHVRKGDFFCDPINKTVHGVDLSLYYHHAINLVLSKISRPHFFLFSDDPVEALKLFPGRADITLVDHNTGPSSYNDMHLMSQCRHHILANSTFSWWAAWLGDYQKGITIVPNTWFLDKTIDTSDLYCKNWIRL